MPSRHRLPTCANTNTDEVLCLRIRDGGQATTRPRRSVRCGDCNVSRTARGSFS
jgi:hypothetical protein